MAAAADGGGGGASGDGPSPGDRGGATTAVAVAPVSGGRRRDGRNGRAVVGEELAPRLRDGGWIGPEALEHVLDEPRIGPEGPGRGWRRAAVRTG